MKNFKVIKSENITFGNGVHLERCTLRCNDCKRDFITNRKRLWNDYGEIIEITYDYKYCPYCANKLESDE